MRSYCISLPIQHVGHHYKDTGTGDHGCVASEAGTEVLQPQAKEKQSLAEATEASRSREDPPALPESSHSNQHLTSAFQTPRLWEYFQTTKVRVLWGVPENAYVIISSWNKVKIPLPQTYPSPRGTSMAVPMHSLSPAGTKAELLGLY